MWCKSRAETRVASKSMEVSVAEPHVKAPPAPPFFGGAWTVDMAIRDRRSLSASISSNWKPKVSKVLKVSTTAWALESRSQIRHKWSQSRCSLHLRTSLCCQHMHSKRVLLQHDATKGYKDKHEAWVNTAVQLYLIRYDLDHLSGKAMNKSSA